MGNKGSKKKLLDQHLYTNPNSFDNSKQNIFEAERTPPATPSPQEVPFDGPQQAPLILSFKHDVAKMANDQNFNEEYRHIFYHSTASFFHTRTSKLYLASLYGGEFMPEIGQEHWMNGIFIFRVKGLKNDGNGVGDQKLEYSLENIILAPLNTKPIQKLFIDYWNRLVVQVQAHHCMFFLKIPKNKKSIFYPGMTHPMTKMLISDPQWREFGSVPEKQFNMVD